MAAVGRSTLSWRGDVCPRTPRGRPSLPSVCQGSRPHVRRSCLRFYCRAKIHKTETDLVRRLTNMRSTSGTNRGPAGHVSGVVSKAERGTTRGELPVRGREGVTPPPRAKTTRAAARNGARSLCENPTRSARRRTLAPLRCGDRRGGRPGSRGGELAGRGIPRATARYSSRPFHVGGRRYSAPPAVRRVAVQWGCRSARRGVVLDAGVPRASARY
jgi:hypothetical protein